MDIPIIHPTAIRFYLEKTGINPCDDHSVVQGYGCLRLLEHIVKTRGWKYPLAAYRDIGVHGVLAECFPEAVQEIDARSDSEDFWKPFSDAYDHVLKIPFSDFVRNVCPNFLIKPNECVELLGKEAEFHQTGFSPDTSHSLHVIAAFRCRYAESFEQAYITYQHLIFRAGLTPVSDILFRRLYTAVNCYELSGVRTRTSANAVGAIDLLDSVSLPRSFQVDIYAMVHKLSKDIDNPFQYLRATRDFPNPLDSVEELERVFNRTADLLQSVSPSEFLETLTTESSRKKRGAIPDAATECGLICPQFTNYLSAVNARKVLIVNPSIPFIRQWIKKETLSKIETYFCMEYESSALILAEEFASYQRSPHSASVMRLSIWTLAS